MANKVIAAGFDSQHAALAAAWGIQRLESNGVVKVKRGVIVSKDQHGNLSIPGIREVGDSWGLLGGGVIGALLGLLLGPAGTVAGAAGGAAVGALADAANLGLSRHFLRDVNSKMQPGQTVLLAELEEGSPEPVDAAVRSHGGHIYRDTLPETA